MNSEEINSFWDFERERSKPHNTTLPGQKTPLLIKDIYHRYVAPRLQEARVDWDNKANDRYYLDPTDATHKWEQWQKDKMKNASEFNELEKKAHLSFESCAAACRSLPAKECFSYKYQSGICMTSKAFTLGKPVKQDMKGGRMMSGWDVEKIKAFIQEQGDCHEVHWPKIKEGGRW